MELLGKIKGRVAKTGVIGLGYAGLPLAVEFGKGGFFLTGFGVDSNKPGLHRGGKSYVSCIPSRSGHGGASNAWMFE